MFEIIPFKPEHIGMIDAQEAQQIDRCNAEQVPFGDAWTALGDGHPVACAGLVEAWPGRAYAWALLGKHAGRWLSAITRAVRRALDVAPFKRIEMAVDAGFVAGQRWAVMLGFELETPRPLRAYMPGGQSAFLYGMVR